LGGGGGEAEEYTVATGNCMESMLNNMKWASLFHCLCNLYKTGSWSALYEQGSVSSGGRKCPNTKAAQQLRNHIKLGKKKMVIISKSSHSIFMLCIRPALLSAYMHHTIF